MPRPRPPHLHRQVTRHGQAVWYVRVGHGARVRIKAEFGTAEFDEQYRAALSGATLTTRKAPPSYSTLAWLLARYRETTAWSELSPAFFQGGAQEKTRTSTPFRALAPEASASTSSATWA